MVDGGPNGGGSGGGTAGTVPTPQTQADNIIQSQQGWGVVQPVCVMPNALSIAGMTVKQSGVINGTFVIRGIKIQCDKPTGNTFARFGWTSGPMNTSADLQSATSLILPQSVFANSAFTFPCMPVLFGAMDMDDLNFQVLQPNVTLWAALELNNLPSATNLAVTFLIEPTT
jgi:hypothetical protein